MEINGIGDWGLGIGPLCNWALQLSLSLLIGFSCPATSLPSGCYGDMDPHHFNPILILYY